MKQRTIAKCVDLVGIGLHKGVPVQMRLEPLPKDSGIVLYRKDKNVKIPLHPKNVVDTKMATVLGKDGVSVSTIEHLMSAVYSYGIDNLLVILDNDEVPIMDGSAIAYCMLLDEARICVQNAPKKLLKIKREVKVQDGEKYALLRPSDGFALDFTIDFDHPAIGRQHYHFEFDLPSYIEQIARARTFGFLHQVQYLRSQGLALGGSLDNAIVLDEKRILNPEGLRYEDEFVRHKILDAIGDLSLFGMALMGEYEAYAASHHLNHLLTQKVLEDTRNYEVVEAKTKTMEGYVIGAACAKE